MTDIDPTFGTTRHTSQNSNVDIGGREHQLRGTGQTNLNVFDQYIKKSTHDEYCPRLRYWKKKKGEYLEGFPAEFTLSHDEAKALHAVLAQGLAVAAEGESGDFLTLPNVSRIADNLERHDPTVIAPLVAQLVSGEGVIRALAAIPDSNSLVAGIQAATRVAALESATRELSTMLSEGVVAEDAYQDWCEMHWVAFGPVYVARDEVRSIALGDNVDLLMERTANGLRDVLELKRPNMPVLNYDSSHKSYYWSAETSRALGQCHRYLDALHEGAARGLRDNEKVVAYHPQAIVVIGRSADWGLEKRKQLHGLNARLHGITVMTYDDVHIQAERLVEVLKGSLA